MVFSTKDLLVTKVSIILIKSLILIGDMTNVVLIRQVQFLFFVMELSYALSSNFKIMLESVIIESDYPIFVHIPDV